MKTESPRVCKLCGGPNHYGCGCEAKAATAAIAAGLSESEAPAAAPAAETQTPAELEQPFNKLVAEVLKRCTKADIEKILEGSFDMAKDIKTMADGFEGLCACFYDTNNYLKIIAGDLITIRKFLTKEDVGTDGTLSIISYLSNIDQTLKEIKAGRSSDAG